ncbi:MAG: hypothetical protein K2F99_04340 [Muribaculaceae bacterium]|nr:hypothetical protein [Muribaculaceae bacterium]
MRLEDLYYIRHSFRRQANAGSKPSTDIEAVLASIGARGLGLPGAYFAKDMAVHLRDIINSAIVKATMPRNKAILLQYPAQYDIEALARCARKRGNRLIVVVHDINALRGRPEADHADVLAEADAILAHTPAMKAYLEELYPQARVIVPGMFDYIQANVPQGQTTRSHSVVFAGNLGKSGFLSNLEFSSGLRLVLFGVGAPESLIEKAFVDYRGSCMPEEIPARICDEGFGLVWDGNSTSGCTGPMGEYLRYNAPYKLSSYIAAGIPVVIWSEMGITDFVTRNGLGIAVDSLDELEATLNGISNEEYEAMKRNVRKVQEMVSRGDFARSAILEALSLL